MPKHILQVDQPLLETELDRMVTEKVTQILNSMLDTEADELAGVGRYERSDARKAYRAGHYQRDPTIKAGKLSVRVPKLKGALFELAVIERYRRREESARGGADRHGPGGRLHQTGRRHQPGPVGFPDAVADPVGPVEEGMRKIDSGVSARCPGSTCIVHGRGLA